MDKNRLCSGINKWSISWSVIISWICYNSIKSSIYRCREKISDILYLVWNSDPFFIARNFLSIGNQIAKFMGQTWGPPRSCRWAPCWPHKPCYQGMKRALYRVYRQIVYSNPFELFRWLFEIDHFYCKVFYMQNTWGPFHWFRKSNSMEICFCCPFMYFIAHDTILARL